MRHEFFFQYPSTGLFIFLVSCGECISSLIALDNIRLFLLSHFHCLLFLSMVVQCSAHYLYDMLINSRELHSILLYRTRSRDLGETRPWLASLRTLCVRLSFSVFVHGTGL